MVAILNFEFFRKMEKHKFAFISLTVQDFVEIFNPTNAKRHEAEIIYMYTNKYLSIMIYFTNETGSCKTTVQFLQKVHGVDITHDNVCSSMLSCFYSYVATTINRASYF